MSKRIGNEDLLNQETGPVKMDAGSVAEPTEQTPSTNKPSTNQGTSEPKAPEGTNPDVPKSETPQRDVDSGKSEDLTDKPKEGTDKANSSNKDIGDKPQDGKQDGKEPKQHGSKQIKGGDQKLSKMDGLANGNEGDKGNTFKTFQKIQKGVNTAKNAGEFGLKVSFLNNALKFGAQAVQSVVGWFTGMINGVTSFVTGLISGILNAGAWAVGSVVGVIVGTIGAIAFVFIGTTHRVDDTLVGCGPEAKDTVRVASEETSNLTAGQNEAKRFETAQKIVSALRTAGWSDEQIAGALGNAEAESKLDPTMVEGFYGEAFQMGPKKEDIFNNKRKYLDEVLYPAYAREGISLDKNTYEAGGGSIGIGLWQITGGRQHTFSEWVKQNNVKWGTVEAQVAYMLNGDNRGEWLKQYTATKWGSPREAAGDFARGYEGNTTLAQEERRAKAEYWYSKMSDMKTDSAYGESVLALAKTAKIEASSNGANAVLNRCETSRTGDYDNSSIARAAISIAWDNMQQSLLNNGTEVYQKVKELIFPNDPYNQSCDRSAATAIRWSGADDDFPVGAVEQQLAYLQTSDKWEEIHWNQDVSKLQPGDVFIRWEPNPGVQHIMIYLGNKIVREIRPDNPGELMQGSYGAGAESTNNGKIQHSGAGADSRSPALFPLPGTLYETFRVFRNVKQETNSKYKNILTTENGSDSISKERNAISGQRGTASSNIADQNR
jgi:hypothetical protein